MELLELSQREHLSREEAAARLREIADHLASHNDVEVERGGAHLRVHVPDEVQLKLELEVADDGTELEIELTW